MITAVFASDFPPQERPACPECGGITILSRGTFQWQCAECGRKFAKLRRTQDIDYTQRPRCHYCGGLMNKHSAGRMICKDCLKTVTVKRYEGADKT